MIDLEASRNTFLQTVRAAQSALATLSPMDSTESADDIMFRRASTIKPVPIRWTWPGRIPRGKVSLFCGDPGGGKSQLTTDIAARVTTARAFPDDSPCEMGNVVILNAEDDAGDTIVPRLEAAGADINRVVILDAIREQGGAKGNVRRVFNLQSDVGRLAAFVQKIGGASLIIIDPISAYLGKVDSHKNAEVRALLAVLGDMAAQHDMAVIGVTHFSKDTKAGAMMRVMGSLAFVAAARATYLVARDPADKNRRLFVPLKVNISPDRTGYAFTLEEVRIKSSEGQIDVSRVRWEASPIQMTADEVMQQAASHDQHSELAETKEFLLTILAHGPLASRQVYKECEEAGPSRRTIQRAGKAIGIEVLKDGVRGGWSWRLPPRSPSANLGDLGDLRENQLLRKGENPISIEV